MDFEITQPIQGDPRAALRAVRRRLGLEDWFDQVEETGDGLRLRRAMPLVRTGRHRPIQGLAAVELAPLGRQLLARGEYARTGRFLLWFLPGLALVLGGAFAAARMFQALWILPLVFAPWIAIGPVMVRLTQARARRALESMLREALAGAAPDLAAPTVNETTTPIDVRGDIAIAITVAGDPARAVENFRSLIAKDFRFGSSDAHGFRAAKPWIGFQGGERLPFIGRLDVSTAGREVTVRADYTGIGFIAALIGGAILAGIGVLVYFLMTVPAARKGLTIGLGCCAPELILLPFVPLLLKQYARRRLERLLKTAV